VSVNLFKKERSLEEHARAHGTIIDGVLDEQQEGWHQKQILWKRHIIVT
jgi:hypothetical protein